MKEIEGRVHGLIGRGVQNCNINADGHLIFLMTDGTNIDLGSINYGATIKTGTAISGVQIVSGISPGNIDDMYLNTSTANIYRCIAADDTEAVWQFEGNLTSNTIFDIKDANGNSLVSNGIATVQASQILDAEQHYEATTVEGALSEAAIKNELNANNLTDHLSDKTNPHSVNLKQVGGSNKNLLDNWDFTNPVNQRGETSYTSGYTIDRWKMTGTGTVTVNSGSLTLQRTGDWFNFFQIIDNPQSLAGKTVTLSVKGSGNYNILFAVNGTYPTTANYNNAAVGIASITYTLPAELTAFVVYIQPKSDSANTVYSTKLELGSVSTLANDPPMDYQSEYLKCLRYYYQGELAVNDLHDTQNSRSGYRLSNLVFPVPMRIAPTVSFVNHEISTKEGFTDVSVSKYMIKKVYVTGSDWTSTGDYMTFIETIVSADL